MKAIAWENFYAAHGSDLQYFLDENENLSELLETGSVTYTAKNGMKFVISLKAEF